MKASKLFRSVVPGIMLMGLANAYAQTPSATPFWTAVYNNTITTTNPDNARSVICDGSGNVYVTGVLNKVPGTSDFYTGNFKYSKTGTTAWSRFYNGGTGSCGGESGNQALVDASFNVWVVGTIYDGTSGAGSLALWKYNSSGTLQTNYPKIISSNGCTTGGTVAGGFGLAIAGSDVYVCGSQYDNSTTKWYFVVAKNDPSGTGWSWTYTYNNSGPGQNEEHRALDIKVTGTGATAKIYATGWVNNASGSDKDIYTIGLDASGAVLTGWGTGVIYTGGGLADDIGYALGVDGSGYVYVAGVTKTLSHGKDGFLTKYSSAGALQTGYPTLHDRGGFDDGWNDIEVLSGVSPNPAVYVGGYSSQDNGNKDYALRAYTSTGGNPSGWSGHILSTVYYDGSWSGTEPANTDVGMAIKYSATTGRVYITGMSAEPCSTGCASADVNLTTLGFDASNGNTAWPISPAAASYDSNTDQNPQDDECYWKNNLDVYYSSCYATDVILVTGATWSASTNFDYVTIQYGHTTGACSNFAGDGGGGRIAASSAQPQEVIGIYPNPFSSTAEVRIESGKELADATLTIIDVQGRVVSKLSNISSKNFVFNRGNLQPGLYFFKVIEKGAEISSGKFVIAD